VRRSPTFAKLILLVLVLPCLYSMYLTFMKWWPSDGNFVKHDVLTAYEMKMAGMRSDLHGVEAVRYLGDHSKPSDAEAQRNFQIAQYVLAPILLTDKRPSRYAISLVPLTPQMQSEIQGLGLILSRDYGEDLRLFEKRRP